MKSKHIKRFVINKAKYIVRDGNGIEMELDIDYFNNHFEVITNKESDPSFVKDVEAIAKELLKKKHKVNFASKFK